MDIVNVLEEFGLDVKSEMPPFETMKILVPFIKSKGFGELGICNTVLRALCAFISVSCVCITESWGLEPSVSRFIFSLH